MTNTILRALKEGTMTPEEAVQADAKGPFKKLTDIPVSALVDTFMPSGFPTLDEHCVLKSGVGELIVVAARPRMGKSAFIMQVATFVAQTRPVLLFSAEMGLRAITQRMVAGQTGYGLRKVKNGEGDPKRYEVAYAELDALDYRIVDEKGVDISTLCALARDWKAKKPLPGLIVIDYLQIIGAEKLRSRTEEVGFVAQAMSDLAAELKTPILTAAQVNRNCELRGLETGDFTPCLADLAESSKTEHVADCIIGLSREEVYTGKRQGKADISILKNRSGQTGSYVFSWLGASTRFVDGLGEVDI